MPTRKGYRVSKINIDLPKQGEMPWLSLHLEGIEVDENNNIVSITPNVDQIVVRADAIAMTVLSAPDPVLGQNISMSGAGAQELVRRFAVDLIGKKYGTFFDETVGTGKAMFP